MTFWARVVLLLNNLLLTMRHLHSKDQSFRNIQEHSGTFEDRSIKQEFNMRYHPFFKGFVIVFCLLKITTFVFAEDMSVHQANLNIVERLTRFEEGQKAIVNEMRTRFQAVDQRIEERQKAIINEMRTRFQVVDQRIEEGQKAIVNEMRTRFQAVDQRFEILEKSIDKRFEAIDKRFEAVDKRFESLIREMNQRFESIEKRFELIEKRLDSFDNQMTSMGSFIFTMLSAVIALIIGLIGFIVWDRKSVFDKMEKLFQSHVEKYHTPESLVIQEKDTHAAADTQNLEIVEQLTNGNYKISKNMQEKIREVFNFLNQFPEMRPVLNPA